MKRFRVIFISIFMSGPSIWAASIHTREATQYLYKALTAYDREDYGAAKINMQAALNSEPNFAEAYMLKGLLDYRDGRTDEAHADFERALKLNPRLPDTQRERLEKQAHALEGGLTQQDFAHFVLQFHGASERDKAWQAIKSLDDVYNELGSQFSVFPSEKISVVIFNTEEFWEAWNAPFWLGGFFDKRDGKIRVRMDEPPGGDEEYRRRLRHEFTHAFIYQLYPKELPVWFHEGVAQFYAYKNPTDSFWKDKRLEELRKLMKGAPRLDLEKMQQVISKKNVSPGLIYLAYLESEAFVLYVAKERGDSWIPNFITALRQGASFDAAFLQVTGVSPADTLDHLHHGWE